MDLSHLTNEHYDAILKIGKLSSGPIKLPNYIFDDLCRLDILKTFANGNTNFAAALGGVVSSSMEGIASILEKCPQQPLLSSQ